MAAKKGNSHTFNNSLLGDHEDVTQMKQGWGVNMGNPTMRILQNNFA